MLHDELQMRAYIVLCPNIMANDRAKDAPFESRHFFWSDVRVNPGDPAAMAKMMAWREKLVRPLAKADGFMIIDSDPGGYAGSNNHEFAELLLAHRKLFDRLRPGIELNYWVLFGWPAYSRFYETGDRKFGTEHEFDEIFTLLKERNPEPWGLAMHATHGEAQLGLAPRVLNFRYARIEAEPSFPLTNFNNTGAYEAGKETGPRGVMGNAQTHCVQLPNTFAFARGATGQPLTESDYEQFADDLIPGQGKLIVQAWKILQQTDVEAMERTASELEKIAAGRPEGGSLKGLLLGSPERFLIDLVFQLRMCAAAERLYVATDTGTGVPDALGKFAAAAERWQQRHGYQNRWNWPKLSKALEKVNSAEINVVLHPPIYGQGFEAVRQKYYLTETFTSHLIDAMKATASKLQAKPVAPPSDYHHTVERGISGTDVSVLVAMGRPAFRVMVSEPGDEVLQTAAEDFSTYFRQRLGQGPAIGKVDEAEDGNLVVLATHRDRARLPAEWQRALPDTSRLNEQAYVIQRVPRGEGGFALVCVGGSAVAARYATVDILRRMDDGAVRFTALRDEPYSTWRAVYINDSAHQVNNYSPNLIFPVETFRWPMEKWRRYIDQLAFFRYNVLTIWIVPNMFSPEVFNGGEEFDYFRDTMRAVAQYAKPRGIKLSLLGCVNAAVKAGTRLDTVPTPVYKDMPLYTYLNPSRPEEKQLLLRLWDHWSKAIPEVGIWELFPGDPGGSHEVESGPETYVDLALEITQVIKKNNPKAQIDFTPWQFFGWGNSWPSLFRSDTARVDRGYRYLMTKLPEFPADTIFSPNLNDATSEPPVEGAGGMGGATVKYIEQMARHHLVHTWTYFTTEGEGWINHAYKVPDILKQRDIEARYPISGGLCYTMTPSLNVLNQYASAEAFWDPTLSPDEVMKSYGEGIFGTANAEFLRIFPLYDIAPMIGYTFASSPSWKPDYAAIEENMRLAEKTLTEVKLPPQPRFTLQLTPSEYTAELLYYSRLYQQVCALARKVSRARELVKLAPAFHNAPSASIHAAEARGVLDKLDEGARKELASLLEEIAAMNVAEMKARFQTKHYQLFLDYPTEFTPLLPNLVNGFFNAFGADFVDSPTH